MFTKRKDSYIVYIVILFMCSILLFGNLFSRKQQAVIEISKPPMIDNRNSQKPIARSSLVVKPKAKSIFLDKISLTTGQPQKTVKFVNLKEIGVDSGLVRLYNEIAERKINKILQRTISEDSRTMSHDKTTTSLYNSNYSNNLPLCTEFPQLVGFQDVNLNYSNLNASDYDVEQIHDDVDSGHWRPKSCAARHKVAIIIPFRDREKHLSVLLQHLLPIWKRQLLYFKIYVVEQFGDEAFNKGRVMNAGFLEAVKEDDFHCFVFHDVDLIPLSDYNLYSCPQNPRHMSVLVDELGYQYPYEELAGGVFSIRTEHFQMVNGYNNLFWGWGAEDDDMGFRVQRAGLRLERPPSTIAQYKMIRHKKRKSINAKRKTRILHNKKQKSYLNGVNSVNYKIISDHRKRLYRHLVLDIGHFDNYTLI